MVVEQHQFLLLIILLKISDWAYSIFAYSLITKILTRTKFTSKKS